MIQATCANGVVTEPTIELATTPGRHLRGRPGRAVRRHGDTTVTVTATLADGFGVGPDADGLDSGRCDDGDVHGRVGGRRRATVVTPAAPTVVSGGVCRRCGDGADVDVARSTDGSPTASSPRRRMCRVDVVVVTATLDAAGSAGRSTLPTGWTDDGDDGDVRR